MKSITIILFFFIFGLGEIFSNSPNDFHIISGIVKNNSDSIPLPGVTIKVADAQSGAISNKLGEFKMKLPKRDHTLIFTMIGKHRLIYDVLSSKEDSVYIEFFMNDNSVMKDEVIVIAEDPGVKLMRQVIDKKQKIRDSLTSYTYMLYTKFVASTDTITAGRKVRDEDTTIVSILESYSKGYFQSPDKYFNEIIQKKQSVNVPPQANFVAFGTNLNAYDDFINLVGEEIYTPFHFNALEFYDFIMDTEYSDTSEVLDKIIVSPQSDYAKVFRGIVYINRETLFPEYVQLYPNKAVKLPFGADLDFKQNFQIVNQLFCMPYKMHIYTTLQATFAWIFSPRLDINIRNVAYDFEINPILDKSLFRKRRVETSKVANKYDSTFWRDRRKILLTPKEAAAYEEIRTAQENPDSVLQTGLLRQITAPIEEKLAILNRRPFTGLEDIFRFNRVQGGYLGAGLIVDFYELNTIKGNIGYGFANQRWQGKSEMYRYFDEDRQFGVFGKAYNYLDRSDDKELATQSIVTLGELIFKNGYGDYYYNQGFEAGFEMSFGQLRFISRDNFRRPRILRLIYKNERHENAYTNSNFSILSRNLPARINPPIIEGKYNSIKLEWYHNYAKKRRLSNFGFYLSGEYSDKSFLQSDFDFLQFNSELRTRFKTLPLWKMHLNIKSGITFGNVPPQRFFSLEAAYLRLGVTDNSRGLQVKEFYGDRYFMINMEHNFGEIIPGVFTIPNVASFGLEFITFASLGWSAFNNAEYGKLVDGSEFIPNSTDITSDRYYYDLGIGINRVFIFFRVDVGYRFSQMPRTLITISTATF